MGHYWDSKPGFQTPSPEFPTSSELHQEPSASKSALMSWAEEYGGSPQTQPCVSIEQAPPRKGETCRRPWEWISSWDLITAFQAHSTLKDGYLSLTSGWPHHSLTGSPAPLCSRGLHVASSYFSIFRSRYTKIPIRRQKHGKGEICFMTKGSCNAVPEMKLIQTALLHWGGQRELVRPALPLDHIGCWDHLGVTTGSYLTIARGACLKTNSCLWGPL